jgi:transposase-like protein
MVNKHYPLEFKADAVALYRSRPGTTVAQIADDLDPTTNQEQPDPKPTAAWPQATERASLKPTSSTRKVGWLRRRTDARQLQCSSNQPPPRRTR